MNELQRLIDALDLMCGSANGFHHNAGAERIGDGMLHAEVRATLWTRNCADVQADVILMGTRRTVNGNGDIADEHVRRVVAHAASIPTENKAPLFVKTGSIGAVVNEIHLSIFSQVVNGLRDGTLFDLDLDPSDIGDNMGAECAENGCAPEGVIEEADGIEAGSNAKAFLRDAAVAKLETLLNRIKGDAARTACEATPRDARITAEHPAGTPADGETTEATVGTDSPEAVAAMASDRLAKHLKALVTAFRNETGHDDLHFTNHVSDNVIRITVRYDVITAAAVNFTVRPDDTTGSVARDIFSQLLDSLCSYFKVRKDRMIRACGDAYDNLPAKPVEGDATDGGEAQRQETGPKPARRRTPRIQKDAKLCATGEGTLC